MLRTGPGWWLLPLLFLLLPGCATYYRVEVGGDRPEQAHSVFLIVADKNPLAQDNKEVSALIRSERIGDYLLFAQFDPYEGTPLRWRQLPPQCRSELIGVELSQDQSVVKLRVDKELLQAYSDLTVIVVGHGANLWYSEVFDSGKIRNEGGVRLEVGTSRFVIRPLK